MTVEFAPEYCWRRNAKGNHIMMDGNTHRATVFRAGSCWRIIVNGLGVSRIAANEFFDYVSEAKRRTEMIAAGEADDARMVMIPQRP